MRLIFKDGEYYEYDPGASIGAANIQIKGTAQNPVIFDSESGIPGSWGGIFLRAQSSGWWDIDHFIIRNGGGFVLPNATEKANVSVERGRGHRDLDRRPGGPPATPHQHAT